jgi:hypothetical protein
VWKLTVKVVHPPVVKVSGGERKASTGTKKQVNRGAVAAGPRRSKHVPETGKFFNQPRIFPSLGVGKNNFELKVSPSPEISALSERTNVRCVPAVKAVDVVHSAAIAAVTSKLSHNFFTPLLKERLVEIKISLDKTIQL